MVTQHLVTVGHINQEAGLGAHSASASVPESASLPALTSLGVKPALGVKLALGVNPFAAGPI